MREIVLDTETTGLDPYQGHRLIEIGCIELVNRFPTGQTFHATSIPNATCRPRRSPSTASRPSCSRTSRGSPRSPTNCSRSSAMRRWSRTTRCSISASSMPSSSAPASGLVARERLVDTLLLARRKTSGRLEPARRSVRALRHRQFAPHQARRAARRRAAGRGLSRADRRAPGASSAWSRSTRHGGRRVGRRVTVRAHPYASLLRPRLTEDERAAHVAFVATLGESAIWREYVSPTG